MRKIKTKLEKMSDRQYLNLHIEVAKEMMALVDSSLLEAYPFPKVILKHKDFEYDTYGYFDERKSYQIYITDVAIGTRHKKNIDYELCGMILHEYFHYVIYHYAIENSFESDGYYIDDIVFQSDSSPAFLGLIQWFNNKARELNLPKTMRVYGNYDLSYDYLIHNKELYKLGNMMADTSLEFLELAKEYILHNIREIEKFFYKHYGKDIYLDITYDRENNRETNVDIYRSNYSKRQCIDVTMSCDMNWFNTSLGYDIACKQYELNPSVKLSEEASSKVSIERVLEGAIEFNESLKYCDM